MPNVEVVVDDNVIAVNGVGYHFSEPFPHEDNLKCLIWRGTPESGYGRLVFYDDYDMELGPTLYEEEVMPYIALWQAQKRRVDQEAIDREAELNRFFNSTEYKLRELRNRRQERLTLYDNVTSQLDRMYRLAETDDRKQKIDALQRKWDEYAQTLCNLTDNPDSPWDGGMTINEPNSVPWPTEPPLPNTIK